MAERDATGVVAELLRHTGRGREAAIPLLQGLQAHYGWLPPEALEAIGEQSEVTPAQLAGVASFYTRFRQRPAGRHRIRVCDGTACHVRGAELVRDALRRHLHLPDGEDTDPARVFTLETVACLGCCTLAPAIQIDETTYGHLTPALVPEVVQGFLALRAAVAAAPRTEARRPAAGAGEVRVGLGSCCVAKGSGRLFAALQEALAELGGGVRLKRVGCVGMCHQVPLMEVVGADGGSHIYARVQAEDVAALLARHFRPSGAGRRLRRQVGRLVDRMLLGPNAAATAGVALDLRGEAAAPFLERQRHVATEHGGVLDPLDLEEYRAHDGFEALRTCLERLDPDAVIGWVAESGLRGRGGAGYPTGVKWRHVREAAGDSRTVIANGDEGDPGAFMDRMLLESYPYRVIEGMAIAAYAVGAREGILYIRAEYPLAVQRVRAALERCAAAGLLGARIMGRPFDFAARVVEGAGAFVCGEETALIASLEGRRGMPRLRPPYPSSRGLHGRPTLVNNVETLAVVPWIIRHGPAAYAAFGCGRSRGTKVFALAGKVVRGGLIEVPMGVTLRDIVEGVGGGVGAPRRFKAVQVGGPSGGCIPAAAGDTPVDYEALGEAGAMMGSGGLVVLDDADCMVELARYFLGFTQNQSCGRCTFCRIGTQRMLEILDGLCEGRGRPADLGELEHLAHAVKAGSLCGLGRTAPNPVLTTLRHYRGEYEAHLAGRCPAGRCRALIRYRITEDCIGCTLCAQHCPAEAIARRPLERHEIKAAVCIRCGTCRAVCPEHAVEVE
jgi:NADH-quinone oxidoreductase subunit F